MKFRPTSIKRATFHQIKINKQYGEVEVIQMFKGATKLGELGGDF